MDVERCLARRYLDAQGWGEGFFDEIHPLDDMYRTLAHYPLPPHTRAMAYFRDGEHALRAVENALQHAGRPLATVPRFLEFACGHGRFTRFLVHRLARERIHVADVLQDGVDYCRAQLGVQGFHSQHDPRAVDFPGPFDVIYVGSLFSHLPRERFAQWLRRLYEQATDDGLLLFTAHGPQVAPEIEKDAGGYTFVAHSETDKLSTVEYGTTFVEPAVLADLAADCGVRHLYRVDRDVWNSQDLYAASRVPREGLARWRSTRWVWGRLLDVRQRDDGSAWLGGFVRWADWDAPVDEVRLVFDGRDVAAMAASEPALAEPATTHRSAFLQREFYVEGPLPDRSPGPHVVEIVALSADGRRTVVDVRALEVA